MGDDGGKLVSWQAVHWEIPLRMGVGNSAGGFGLRTRDVRHYAFA